MWAFYHGHTGTPWRAPTGRTPFGPTTRAVGAAVHQRAVGGSSLAAVAGSGMKQRGGGPWPNGSCRFRLEGGALTAGAARFRSAAAKLPLSPTGASAPYGHAEPRQCTNTKAVAARPHSESASRSVARARHGVPLRAERRLALQRTSEVAHPHAAGGGSLAAVAGGGMKQRSGAVAKWLL